MNKSGTLIGVLIDTSSVPNQVSAFLYGLFILIANIPLNFIISRENLLQNEICGKSIVN
jgi:hypothetical protein